MNIYIDERQKNDTNDLANNRLDKWPIIELKLQKLLRTNFN